jgi:thioredoxin 1
MATEITDSNFSDTIEKSGKPSVVDFWAPWCGPCRALSPVIDELHSEYSDKDVIIGKVNVDDNPELSDRFKIRSIPQLLFFDKEGRLVESISGFQPKGEIAKKINKLTSKENVE